MLYRDKHALGAHFRHRRGSRSAYVRARALGEERVRMASAPGAVVLRPSVLFGPNDAFVTNLSALIKRLPVIPMFGRGTTRLAPVFVLDVAAAVCVLLTPGRTECGIYELGGTSYTYKEVLQLLARALQRRRIWLPVPFAVWEVLAWIASILPGALLTRDQITLLRHDNVPGPTARTFADLGIAPRPLAEMLSIFEL